MNNRADLIYFIITLCIGVIGAHATTGTIGSSPNVGNGQTTNTQIPDPTTGMVETPTGTNPGSNPDMTGEKKTSHHHRMKPKNLNSNNNVGSSPYTSGGTVQSTDMNQR